MTDQEDQFTVWRRRIAGDKTIPLTEIPESGFYRQKTRDRKGFDAIAYWRDENGTLLCKVGGRMVTDELRALEMWPWVQADPITHELYIAVTERGEPWPDLHDAGTALTNNPPADDSAEALSAAIEDLAREAERLSAAGAAKSQVDADRASDLANKLGELERKAETTRKSEAQPQIGRAS